MSTAEAADALGITGQEVRDLIQDGTIEAERVGRRWEVSDMSVMELHVLTPCLVERLVGEAVVKLRTGKMGAALRCLIDAAGRLRDDRDLGLEERYWEENPTERGFYLGKVSRLGRAEQEENFDGS